MSTRKRIEELEAEALRQGYAALGQRMAERLRLLSPAELAALQTALEAYCRDGTPTPGLIETIKELTHP